MSLAQQIRDALRDSEGMTLAQLADAIGEDAKRIGMTCSERRTAGEFISRREEGSVVYALNPNGAAPKQKAHPPQNAEGKQAVPPPGARSKKPKLQKAAATPKRRDFLAAAETADKTLKALMFAASTADDALQVYLHSVADPFIYGALKQARDHAQAAVAAFTSQGG